MDDTRIYVIGTNVRGNQGIPIKILNTRGDVVDEDFITDQAPYKKVLPHEVYHIGMPPIINHGCIRYVLSGTDKKKTRHCSFITFLYRAVSTTQPS